ncbi:MAG: metallophosphoesterase family protein [Ktedonobacterales bacterium]
MRLAVLSDIHGNPIALDAVLADLQTQGDIDAYWVLGDFVAIGYDPVTPLERVANLPSTRCVRGNTDRYVLTGDLPLQEEQVRADPTLLTPLVAGARGFAWTRGYITATGWFEWLDSLPLEQRLLLPDGTRLLAVHASPGQDADPGIKPEHSDAEVETLLNGCEADLLLVGHTHIALDRQVGVVRVVNPGSVSNPVKAGAPASYVLLEADEQGYAIQHREVEYDREAVIAAIQAVHYPDPAFLIQFMRGPSLVQPTRPG